MVRAAMAELQLVGLAAECEAQDLVAKTDAEDRLLPDQFPDLPRLIDQRLGIAGTVGEEDAVGLSARARPRRDVAAGTTVTRQPDWHQAPEDVALDSVIIGDHVVPGRGRRRNQFGGRAGFRRLGPLV